MSIKVKAVILITTFLIFANGKAISNPPVVHSTPTISEGVYNILDFGAVNNESIFSTVAVQNAIDKCTNAGGGTVYIPPGKYLLGTITLKSNVNLHLSKGATLIASKELKDYKVLQGFVHNHFKEGVFSFINCSNAENVSITGEGEIELNGTSFVDTTRKPEFDFSPVDSVQISQGTLKMGERPNQLLFFNNCKRITIQGIKIHDSSSWTIVMSECSVVDVTDVFIDNNINIPNNDGIHLCSCKDVTITRCKIYSGDDCVAITGITNWNGVSENIIVSSSIFTAYSAGIRIGFLSSKVKNVIVDNVIIYNSNRGILVATGKDGYVKNVKINNCNITTQIKVGKWWGNGEPVAIFIDDKIDSLGQFINQKPTPPIIENIALSHIQSVSDNGVHMIGNKGSIDKVFIDNCNFTLVDSYNRYVAGDFYDMYPGGIRKREKGTISAIFGSGVNNLYLNNVIVSNKLSEQKEFVTDAQFSNCTIKKKEIEYLK